MLTSDHGELLGAHGLYCKNVSGFEEVYQIPLVIAGPRAGRGVVSQARVGLHDLAPTLLELAGMAPIGAPDARSFRTVLADEDRAGEYTRGFAEYHGGRYRLTQRVVWDGAWKLVWNGFDFDELYDLEHDPYEMNNLIDDPGRQERVEALMRYAWPGRARHRRPRALPLALSDPAPGPGGAKGSGRGGAAREQPMSERLLRYRSRGPVDLGYGLGTAPPIVLRLGDRLDLMIGCEIWTMQDRDDRGLPFYGAPVSAAIDENLGWSSVERRGPRRTAALLTTDDGTPLETLVVRARRPAPLPGAA